VEDPSDPFRVAELTGPEIAEDSTRLYDEAAAMPLTGGRRVVRVRDADPSMPPGAADAVVKAATSLLEDPPSDSLVIMQAGDLGARSSLRKIFESAGKGIAIPCYRDDARDLDRVFDEILGSRGITLAPDARAWLTYNLGSDRGITRAELEKLALYAGEGGRIEFADAEACIGDSGQRNLDKVAFAAVGGNRRALDTELAACLDMGETAVGILRATARHLMRVHLAMAETAGGTPVKVALKKLQPPVFWKDEAEMGRQVQAWNMPRIGRAQEIVLEAERICKRTGMPDEAICGRALLQVAALSGSKKDSPASGSGAGPFSQCSR